ncbi:hypothetical protein [Paenibacillus whitsoniae]|uniref:HEAT repeat domain-containing protein n=1 Tax=Paenibacillus whitsoniae TaxID=2496558 RepID=A0A3S0CS86_9BACL|nr:hypothetical protein [Paenibacillus whitsoniae]RTE07023.1 hypothetical protein EJQ19_22005 [Paenibacillus whitsoniae]
MDEKRIYRPLDDLSVQKIKEILIRNQLDELLTLPLSVGENHTNWKVAQDLCAQLSNHESPAVRANAVLGFAYIARTKGKLEKHVVKPIILRELRENHEHCLRVHDAINDINMFLKWKLGKKALDGN